MRPRPAASSEAAGFFVRAAKEDETTMGSLFSAPSAPPPPPLPPEPEPQPAPPPAAPEAAAPPAADPAERARSEADIRRRRGRAAFIATSPRGILAEDRRTPTRKTLLGE